MKVRIDGSELELTRGNITEQSTQAIVNAANESLAPGGGVAGAIHRAAGPELWEECKKLRGCRTGEAKLTKGYNLPAPYVIHTVGPVYSGSPQDAKLLEACYKNSLKLAVGKGIKSVSFPAISTGAFGYPMEKAARVALKAVIAFMKEHHETRLLVRFVLYSPKALRIHEEALNELLKMAPAIHEDTAVIQ